MSDNEDIFVLSELVIQSVMVNGKAAVVIKTPDGQGLSPSGIELLGMVRWAEHLIVNDYLGEVRELDE